MLFKTSMYLSPFLALTFACTSSVKKVEVVNEVSNEKTEETIEERNLATDSTLIVLNNFNELDSIFDLYNYSLEAVRTSNEVPRIFVHEIKESLREESSKTRQFDFIRMMLSNALKVNESILEERTLLMDLAEKEELNAEETASLDELMAKYKGKDIADLKTRINIIPPSLILCQAIMESGWGKSHFAYEGNSIFGEHARVGSPNSIKAKGANIALHTFPSIYFAVQSYVLNLNHNNAYRSLRAARTQLINEGKEISGMALANTQDHYSEKGHEYAEHLKKVISLYHLGDFDDCSLANETTKIILIRK